MDYIKPADTGTKPVPTWMKSNDTKQKKIDIKGNKIPVVVVNTRAPTNEEIIKSLKAQIASLKKEKGLIRVKKPTVILVTAASRARRIQAETDELNAKIARLKNEFAGGVNGEDMNPTDIVDMNLGGLSDLVPDYEV